MDTTKQKAHLRKDMQELLARFTDEQRTQRSAEIVAKLKTFVKENSVRQLAVFVPLHNEPDIVPFLQRCRSEKIATVFPVQTLEGPRFSFSPELLPWSPEIVEISEQENNIEMILLPGMAFTRDGKRLGRWGGWYDRAITFIKQKNPTCVLVGVCFSAQLIDDLPVEEHDQRMDMIITEV
jgi:5-formyltetrahydrofolate cyclo-ligase